ncbi:cysteine proteinase [Thozetella sp. PMI_491]|nr:cysteine proteinase [Thozetella sp. PMI_491]
MDKAFIPLESNPDVFNELADVLGAPPELTFEDVLTLDEPDFLPRPALALILVFPGSRNFGSRTSGLEVSRLEYSGSGESEPVVWFKQTIHNACGLYAMLHALSNGEARGLLSKF